MPYLYDTKAEPIIPSDWADACNKSYEEAACKLRDEIEDCRFPELETALNARLNSLNNVQTKRAVCAIGRFFDSSNYVFVSALKSVLEQTQEGIPQELQNNIVAVIKKRQKKSPHEISTQLRYDLELFYSEAKFQLATGELSPTALPVAERYLQEFGSRTIAVQQHIMDGPSAIRTSPDKAVIWCDKLSAYTSAEVALDKNQDRLVKIVSSFNNVYTNSPHDPWPHVYISGHLKQKAIDIIRITETYIKGNMVYMDPNQPGYVEQDAVLRNTLSKNVSDYALISTVGTGMLGFTPRQVGIIGVNQPYRP